MQKVGNIMGTRGTIEIWNHAAAPKSEERPVVLYTHWGANDMFTQLTNVLRRKERWKDPAFLSRMIFCEMIKESEEGTAILTDNVVDTEMEIVVDCDRQEVILKKMDQENIEYTFDDLFEDSEQFELNINE